MRELVVRNITIGGGMPKICVPIVGKIMEDIQKQAQEIRNTSADIVEWRMDYFENLMEDQKVWEVLRMLRLYLPDMPLLVTLRTAKEGGKCAVSFQNYERILVNVAKSGIVDLIDVEAFSFGEIVEVLVEKLHMCGMLVIGSNHDFQRTPSIQDLYGRLKRIREMGADIPKLAMMPKGAKDVLALLNAAVCYTTKEADCPIIVVSMGGYGSVSRAACEIFNSAVTFACLEEASAPGQMNVEELRKMLETFHEQIMLG